MLFVRFFFLSFMLLLCCLNAPARQGIARFGHYDVNDGLTQNSVWQTLQDNSGYMWFVTSAGLNKFDGEHFIAYRNTPDDTNTLYSNHIGSIAKGKGNDIWIGSAGGISLFTGATGKISRFFSFSGSQTIYHILEAEADTLWFWAYDKGVYALNTKTKQIVISIPLSLIHADSTIQCLKVVSKDQEIYFAYPERELVQINKYSRKIKRISDIVLLSGTQPYFFTIQDSFLFFGATNRSGRLGCYNIADKSVQYYHIGNTTATDALISGDDLLIATKENRLVCVKANRHGMTYPLRSTAINGPLSNLYLDRSEVLWVGTDGMGVYKSAPTYRAFRHYMHPSDSQKLVKSIFTHDSFIYACSFNSYMDVYHKNGSYIRQLQYAGNAVFRSICANARENSTASWLAGTECFGVYNTANHSFTDYLPAIREIAPGTTPEPHFCALHKQNNGTVWTGFGNRLFRLSPAANGRYQARLCNTFANERITCITSNGDELVVGAAGKVFCYHPTADKWDKPITLSTDLVKCLLFENDSILWIGTENGLFRHDQHNGKLAHYDERTGLANSFVYGLVRYRNSMWISTNKGLSRYRFKEKSFSNYTVKDGLQSNEFNTGAYHIGNDGQIYFGGPNGVNGFHDTDIRDNPFPPQVQFTGIRLFDEPLKTDTAYDHVSAILLPYNQNTLSFEFIALEFSAPGSNQYAYMMEGIDKDWIYSGSKHFARYAGLRPGSYRFLVKAANDNGTWQSLPKSVDLTITPPYWQRGWFITIVLIAGIGSIALIVYLLQRQQYRKKLALLELERNIQQERERISRDLHDNVGSQISYLVSNIDWINRHKVDEHEQQERLANLSSTAQGMMGNMRETIWALNKNAISLEELSDKLKAFAQQQLAYNSAMKFVSEEQIATDYRFAPGDALNVFRICQEAVSNAIKHSRGNLLTIKITSGATGGFAIQITDTGKGFDIANVPENGHYGLENMKLRAAESGATLALISQPGAGTTITITKGRNN